jgi:hypothetical protein
MGDLDHVTLITAAREDVQGLTPEQRSLIKLCWGGWLTVVEAAAHLGLPVAFTKMLVADLLRSGHITAEAPTAPAPRGPSMELLKEVLRGLQRI